MAAISLLAAKAQNNELPTATLQHGEQTMVFIGVDAFKNAYEAAADSGDVITLSSGLFNAPPTLPNRYPSMEPDLKTTMLPAPKQRSLVVV